jgi:hypothetical protein
MGFSRACQGRMVELGLVVYPNIVVPQLVQEKKKQRNLDTSLE